MPTYLHPGVYVEEIPSGSRPIEGVSTSTAAFVGYTTKGPVSQPQLITKYDDYVRRYGGIRDTGTSSQGDAMGFSVSAFFQNGGTKAYIVRMAVAGSGSLAEARGYFRHPAAGNTTQAVEFTAVNEGSWANGLIVTMTAKASDPQLYTLAVGANDDQGDFVAFETYADVSLDDASARWIESVVNGVSEYVTAEVVAIGSVTDPASYLLGTSTSGDLASTDLDFTAALVADRELEMSLDGQAAFTVTIPAANYNGVLGSLAAEIQAQVRTGVTNPRQGFTAAAVGTTLVLTSGTRTGTSSCEVTNSGAAPTLSLGPANGGTELTGTETRDARISATPRSAELVDGTDGEDAARSDYQAVFTAFEKLRDISVIALPGKTWGSVAAQRLIIQDAISHAQKVKSRMVIVDPQAGAEFTSESSVTVLGLPTSTYSALYYPWARVANPFYDAEDNPGVPAAVLVPPSGYAAGMWARIDGTRGVWKAPAGVEAQLLGLSDLQFVVEDAEQDALNPLGVNALRTMPGFGQVIWGARTLSTRANPEWRYVPVRRTAIFIEQSIYNGIQWAVFEPNDHRLWSSLRANIGSFMEGLFRSGAFQGEKASDAFFVRCGLGDTMTQGDIDRGQVIAIVGFAPLKPAEFVIVRIQQKVAQQ